MTSLQPHRHLNTEIFQNWQLLGQHAHQQGDLERAKNMYREARIQLRKLDDRKGELSRLAIHMARLYRDCRQFKRAELIYKRALETSINSDRSQSIMTAIILIECADLSLEQNKLRSSLATFERIKQALTPPPRRTPPELVTSLLKLAASYHNLGKVDAALAAIKLADAIRFGNQ